MKKTRSSAPNHKIRRKRYIIRRLIYTILRASRGQILTSIQKGIYLFLREVFPLLAHLYLDYHIFISFLFLYFLFFHLSRGMCE
jgi:hypothetical protein